MTDEAKRYRDPVTRQYAYWNNFDRLCKCGHTLGIHVAGGFDCGGKGCKCEKFKPNGKRAEIGSVELTGYGSEPVVR